MTVSDSARSRPQTGPAEPSQRVALIVAIAFFMQFLDGTIISTSLPQMGASLGVPAVGMSVGITVYVLTTVVFVPVSGWLADRFGAREIFAIAIVVFTVSSLACGLAQNLPEFLAARAVQGLGSALMTPVGRLLVLRTASKSELVRATALITWPALFAPVIGPVLGGFITTYATWRWNFFLNLPLGVLGVWLVLKFVPDYREEARQAFDGIGFTLASIGLATLLWGLQRLAEPGNSHELTIGLIVAGLISSGLAVRHLQATPTPLLDLSTFKIQTFFFSTLSAGGYFRLTINATPFLLPLLFQVSFGLSPVGAGLYVFAYFLGNLGMKSVTTPTLRRFGFRNVLIFNGLAASLSIIACAAISPRTPEPLVIALMLIAGLSRSMQFTALATLAFADVPPAQRSSASSLSAIGQQVAMVFGVAFAAAALDLSQYLRGGESLAAADFRVAFIALGAIGLAASFRFLALPRDAAAEVSGHGWKPQPVERDRGPRRSLGARVDPL